MAAFLHHAPCEQCGSRDNKAVYDDGSTWCFGCHKPGRRTHLPPQREKQQSEIELSDDLCFDFPEHVVKWLNKYDISIQEAIKYGWKYSPKWDQLTFLFLDSEGTIAVAQSRNFRPSAKTKYYNQGNPKEVLPIFPGIWCQLGQLEQCKTLVIVEDAVSAARIGRLTDAMPCLGSHLPSKKLMALRPSYEFLSVWLDSDKLKEAREIADRAKWIGFKTKVIYTELDPKEYNDDEIKTHLS